MKSRPILLASLLAVAVASPQATAAEPADPHFAAPSDPVVLTRVVRRGLPDGKEVVSRRTYSVRFSRDGDGFLVEGELISSEVDMPPSLSAFAEIERARPDLGLFPIHLDANGRIVDQQPVKPSVAGQAAVAAGIDRLRRAPLSDSERNEAAAFLRQVLERDGAMVQWPTDLFHPTPGQQRSTRQMKLPDGRSGSVTVAIEVRVNEPGGLLEQFDRTIVTQLEGSQRTVRETWLLHSPGSPF
jgi:hypothetical protein